MDKLISIIIPIYNAEKNLKTTLESIRNQTYSHFEALLVDDGSTDNSPAIAKGFSLQDDRFRYFRKSNSGAGSTRNYGLRLCIGDFITFLDSDDIYYPNYLERMLRALENTGSDICICNADVFDSRLNKIVGKFSPANRMSAGSYPVSKIKTNLFQVVTTVPWDKIIKRTVIEDNRIEFQTIRYSNDNYFTLMCCAHSNTIAYIDDSLIRYQIGSGSSLRDNMVKEPLCDLEMTAKLIQECTPLVKKQIISSDTLFTFCTDVLFKSAILLSQKSETALNVFIDHFHTNYEKTWLSIMGFSNFAPSMKTRFKLSCLIEMNPRGFVWATDSLKARSYDRSYLIPIFIKLLLYKYFFNKKDKQL